MDESLTRSESSQSSPGSGSPRSAPRALQWAALAVITAAWFTDRIPDWRYAMGGVIMLAMPDLAIRLAGRVLPSRK